MRNFVKKTVAVALIAGATLAVSACTKTETNTVVENTTVTENTVEPMEGSMNDTAGTENASNSMM